MPRPFRILALLALGPCLAGAAAGRIEGRARPPFPPIRGFLDERAQGLTLVGTGVRLREGVPFYTVAYYANLTELRAAAGPGPYDRDALARILIEANVSQALITRFQQPVGRERRKEFLLVNLRRWWPEPGFDAGGPALQRFVAFFDEPLARGEETQVWFRAGTAFARKPGSPPQRTADRSVCQAFLASYLSGQVMEGAESPLQLELIGGLPTLLQGQPRLRK